MPTKEDLEFQRQIEEFAKASGIKPDKRAGALLLAQYYAEIAQRNNGRDAA